MVRPQVESPGSTAAAVWRWLRGVGALVLAVAALEYGVVPLIAQARTDVSVISRASWPLLAVATVLEVASLAVYTRLTQLLLTRSSRLRFGTQWRIDLAGYGLSHAIPGGGATASGVRVRLMVDRGVESSEALALTVLQFALSVVGLLSVWLLGVLMAVPRTGVTSTTVALLVVTTLVLSVLEAAPRRMTMTFPRLRGLGSRAGRVLAIVPPRWRSQVRSAVASGTASLRDTNITRQGVAWAAVNWMLDAICLWVCLRAFGGEVPVELVIASYGLANTIALLPITPGGVGIVEGLLVPAMAAAGASAAAAVAGVLTWRLIQFWLPLPAGALCWASLERGTDDRSHQSRRVDQPLQSD